MHPRGYYFYALQQLNKPVERQSNVEAKAAVLADELQAEVGVFLRLGVVMALVIAAVATVTSLAG